MEAPGPKRRRRPAISCILCRRRKIKCNRESPCSNCVKSGNPTCVFDNYPQVVARRPASVGQVPLPGPSTEPVSADRPDDDASQDSSFQASDVAESSGAFRSVDDPYHGSFTLPANVKSGSGNQLSLVEVESMKSRIKQLEEQLAGTSPSSRIPKSQPHALSQPHLQNSPHVSIQTVTTSLAPHFHVHSRLLGDAHSMNRGVSHKTRVFGQSHWIHGAAMMLDLVQRIDPHIKNEKCVAFSCIKKCKVLGKKIKTLRAPSWPTPLEHDLPSKDIADELVDGYFRTLETYYRVLHTPTFKRDYEAIWQPGAKRDTIFMIQLKLVMAIGAAVYDDYFTLRPSAVKWVYEAHTWLSDPMSKSRLTIPVLQINCLLLLAREVVDVSGDMVWTVGGSLFRTAVYMGLHRDPDTLPKKSIYTTEMHRRIWNTILELTLNWAMLVGGPPLLDLDDFECKPPRNFEDEQLLEDDPVPKPDGVFTQVSIAITLRKTFPLRLRICKFLNDLKSEPTYEKVLRFDGELRHAIKDIRKSMQIFFPGTNSRTSVPRYQVRVVDFIMLRYLSSIHLPYYVLSLTESTYAFSRKVVIDTSLKLWYIVNTPPSATSSSTPATTTTSSSNPLAPSPPDVNQTTRARPSTPFPVNDDLFRNSICSSGLFRHVVTQAFFHFTAELRAQLMEEEDIHCLSGGPIAAGFRSDLFAVLRDAVQWQLLAMEAGETNIKGYLIGSLAVKQVECLIEGLSEEDQTKRLAEVAEDIPVRCVEHLERELAKLQPPEEGPEAEEGSSSSGVRQQPSVDTSPDVMQDWDFTMIDGLFNVDNADPMSWMPDQTYF